ncbi:hypothetical protein Q7P37_004460 [Cladosporium fusiforme]
MTRRRIVPVYSSKGAPSPGSDDERQRQEHNQQASTTQAEVESSPASEDDRSGGLTPPSPSHHQQELQSSPCESDSPSSPAFIVTPPGPRASPEPPSPDTADPVAPASRRQPVETIGPPGSFEQQPLFPERFATGTRGPPRPSRRRVMSLRSIQREIYWWRQTGFEQRINSRNFHRSYMGYTTEPPGFPIRFTHDDEPTHREWRWQDVIRLYNARLMDQNIVDNAETVYISSLALLKMLRHGRAGVPMEVMGLMLGEFVDDYTVRVVDVFAMPQSGTGVSVEAVDPVFQTKMMDMLRQTGRPETVVGWYHSHPGFGCWLSSVDINTQQSFEQLTPRAVAVVIDPIQSVKGKVVIDAFRLINPQTLMLGQEPRQTTSNVGHLNKPSIQALIHGLNRHYYSIGIGYRKTALEENMLMNLHKTVWTEALTMPDFAQEGEHNHANLAKLVSLAEGYLKRVQEETELSKEQLRTRYVGKVDPKKHIEAVGQELIEDNIVAVSRQMIDKEASVPTLGQGNASAPSNGVNGHGNAAMEVDGEED